VTGSQLSRLLKALLCHTYALAASGCVQGPVPDTVKYGAPTGFSTLTLVAASAPQPSLARAPVSGASAGAGVGAAQVGVGSLIVGDTSGHFGGGLLLMPLAAGIGAIVGAARARSEADVRKAQDIVGAQYAGDDPARAVVASLIEDARRQGICGVGDDSGAADGDVTEATAAIHVMRYGIFRSGAIDPDIRPFLAGEIIVRTGASPPTERRSSFFIIGEQVPFFQVLEDDGARLRAAREKIRIELGRQVAVASFGGPLSNSRAGVALEKCP